MGSVGRGRAFRHPQGAEMCYPEYRIQLRFPAAGRFGPIKVASGPAPAAAAKVAQMNRIDRLAGAEQPWLTDGGLETTLIFEDGLDLPHFAAYILYETTEGRAALARYAERYLKLASRSAPGFLLGTATWRTNMGWAGQLGHDEFAVRRINAEAVALARGARDAWERDDFPILVDGIIGPAGDGYAPGRPLDPAEAEALHRPQIEALAGAGADLVSVLTMTQPGEAAGVARAARAAGIPAVISFTVETDGTLPDGSMLEEAVAAVDREAGDAVLWYGVNCAHPTHFRDRLAGDWVRRIGLVRANASAKSHAELDEATELDEGDPVDFGVLHGDLARALPGLRVIGGCCGTDHRHVGCAATGHRMGRS